MSTLPQSLPAQLGILQTYEDRRKPHLQHLQKIRQLLIWRRRVRRMLALVGPRLIFAVLNPSRQCWPRPRTRVTSLNPTRNLLPQFLLGLHTRSSSPAQAPPSTPRVSSSRMPLRPRSMSAHASIPVIQATPIGGPAGIGVSTTTHLCVPSRDVEKLSRTNRHWPATSTVPLMAAQSTRVHPVTRLSILSRQQ